MKNIFIFTLFLQFIFPENNYPIFLLHGFLGWGNDELNNYYYWGGDESLEQYLKQKGHEVYTLSVGPISPNWDRAIEVFYQIKGGQVDYGKNHSLETGMIQKPKGKQYVGFYKKWDENNPIHIIAHSQGGQTATKLELLLRQKILEEESLLLSRSLNGWIKSITTISTPHQGTTLGHIILDLVPFIESFAPWLVLLDNKAINQYYNFDLEQWGLKKNVNESTSEFFLRIKNSNLKNKKNLCSWDLSLEGASEFSLTYSSDTLVHYFTMTTYATKKDDNFQYHIPDSTLHLYHWPTAMMMGKYNDVPNKLWHKNDGIVNTISMLGPANQKHSIYTPPSIPGIWQNIGNYNMDHVTIIGHKIDTELRKNIFAIYNEHANLLKDLK
tara:strand:+ start:1235 stop:2383 length:1149 start_codon:yes stop_codon:yes gene_type:complete